MLTSMVNLLAMHKAYAQNKAYTLNDVLQKIVSQYPSIASKQYAVEQQTLQKELVKREQLPEVNVQGQQSYGSYQSVAGSFFPLPGNYNTSGTNKNTSEQPNTVSNLYASAVLQWNFMQFGRIQSKLEVADAAIQISNTALSEEAFRLQMTGMQTYFNALQSKALLKVSKADEQRLAELLDLSKVQANAGLRPGADTLLVKSSYLLSRGIIHDQQAQLETAMLQLASLIGEEVSSFTLDTSAYAKVDRETLPVDGIEQHPYLQYVKANLEYAQASLHTIKRQPYPIIGLLAGVGIRGSGITNTGKVDNSLTAPWNHNSSNYLAGIGITWNLSSLYQNKVKQKIAARNIEAIKADYDAANLQLKTAYAVAVSRWKQQREKVAEAKMALEAAQQGYDLYIVRYENGLINLIELLQLQKGLQDAESNYVKAVGAYWNELIQQSASVGTVSLLLSHINP